jgi:hypothetical protein
MRRMIAIPFSNAAHRMTGAAFFYVIYSDFEATRFY